MRLSHSFTPHELMHFRSQRQGEHVLEGMGQRFHHSGLNIHPDNNGSTPGKNKTCKEQFERARTSGIYLQTKRYVNKQSNESFKILIKISYQRLVQHP